MLYSSGWISLNQFILRQLELMRNLLDGTVGQKTMPNYAMRTTTGHRELWRFSRVQAGAAAVGLPLSADFSSLQATVPLVEPDGLTALKFSQSFAARPDCNVRSLERISRHRGKFDYQYTRTYEYEFQYLLPPL